MKLHISKHINTIVGINNMENCFVCKIENSISHEEQTIVDISIIVYINALIAYLCLFVSSSV